MATVERTMMIMSSMMRFVFGWGLMSVVNGQWSVGLGLCAWVLCLG